VNEFAHSLQEAVSPAKVNVKPVKDGWFLPTGAFEVSVANGGKLLFSKKQTKRFPTVDEVVQALKDQSLI